MINRIKPGFLFITICLLFSANNSFAQRAAMDSAKAQMRPVKNEIALDASYIFRNLSSSFITSQNPISLVYKRHFGNMAIRATLTPSVNLSANKNNLNDTIPSDWSKNRSGNFDIDFRLGVQFKRRLNRFITFYYGVDAIGNFGHNYSISETSNRNSPNSNFTYLQRGDGNQLSKGYGLSPLLGIQVFITRKFAISLENNFTAMHTGYKNTYGNESRTLDSNGNLVPGTDYKMHNSSNSSINTFMNAQNKVYSLNMSVFF